MTDEQMRIAIAESVGYKELFMDNGKSMVPQRWESPYDEFCYVAEKLPDYLNDLNACAEFEKTLTDDELWEYSKLLMDYRQAANGFPMAWRSEVLKLQKATARQRCIAFLKTKGILP